MTDRAKIANVRSILDNANRKSDRRERKQSANALGASTAAGGGNASNVARNSNSASGAKNAMVPVAERHRKRSNRQLRAANDAVSLADRERLELARMEETKLFSDRQLEQLGIVHPRCKNRALVDAMRQMRTKLFNLQREGNFSVLVTSVVPEGGASFVSLNLAATIAFDQSKTSLLVDANLHDPVLHKLLKLIGREETHGLVDYLETPELGIENIVSPSGIPRMRIMPMGTSDKFSNEHFSSQRYQKLMFDIKDRYTNRFVVVDGPSMASSTDAKILSDICDYTILVVPYGGVTPGVLDSIVDEMDERRLAGVVINDQPG